MSGPEVIEYIWGKRTSSLKFVLKDFLEAIEQIERKLLKEQERHVFSWTHLDLIGKTNR